jgi:hypothetical protein
MGRIQSDSEYQIMARTVCQSQEVRWVSIDGGTCHSAALKEDATLYCWGKNDCGQCGRFSWPVVLDQEQVLGPDVLERDFVAQGLPFPPPVDIWEPRLVLPPGSRSSWEVCPACFFCLFAFYVLWQIVPLSSTSITSPCVAFCSSTVHTHASMHPCAFV